MSYTALTEEVKVVQARKKIILDESKDTCVSNTGIMVFDGRKATTAKEIKTENDGYCRSAK